MNISQLQTFMERVLISNPLWVGFRIVGTSYVNDEYHIMLVLYLIWRIEDRFQETEFMKCILEVSKDEFV